MEQQPRNSSAAAFAAMLAQNIVALLEELDQLRAELVQLRTTEAQRPSEALHGHHDEHVAPARPNGGASA